MSKIICEFCGTSYPEAATQCPICGCVRPVNDDEFMGVLEGVSQEHEYHFVKGGRFSAKNVRKRNAAAVSSVNNIEQAKNEEKAPSNKGLVITIFVLLLAIAAVIAYIVLTFFGPEFSIGDFHDETQPTPPATEATVDLSCKEIYLQQSEIVLEEIGAQVQIEPVLTPSNTDEQCTYSTNNDAVATVNASGLVTAISSGEATIIVRCGNISQECKIVVSEPTNPFMLDLTEVTFHAGGESCQLYSGEVNPEEIVWASDDETVALVQNGTVIAVGAGTTTIYASYNGETVGCVVNCFFDGVATEPTADTTQEPIVDNGPYKLKNVFGYSNSDVTIRNGESFTLILVDKNGDKVDGVTWSVTDGSSCSVKDGVVTGNSSGKSTVVASYNGEEHTCIVRVS